VTYGSVRRALIAGPTAWRPGSAAVGNRPFNNGEFTQYLRRIGVILDKECVDADRLPLPLNCHCDISKLPTGQTQSLTSHQRYHRSVIRLHLLANGV